MLLPRILWFKFEDEIQNTSKVIVFTRNHTNDDADDNGGTKNNMSPPVGGGGGRHNLKTGYSRTFQQNLDRYSHRPSVSSYSISKD